MQRVGPVGDLAEVAAACVVLGLEVALQHEPAVAHDHHAMQVPGALVGDELVEPRLEVRGEAGIGGGMGARSGAAAESGLVGCAMRMAPAPNSIWRRLRFGMGSTCAVLAFSL